MGKRTAIAVGLAVVALLIIGSGAAVYWLRGPVKQVIILPPPAPKVAPPSNQIPLNNDTRKDRNAALAMIPPKPASGGQVSTPAGIPQIKNTQVAVAPAVAPVLIAGSGVATPLERALHPSLSPPSGVTPATQPVADASKLTPGTYEYAVNLELQRRFVMSMCTDLSGNLWVGTEGGGVQKFDPKAQKWREWTQYTTKDGLGKDGLGDDFAYAVACDKQGRIWVGHLNHGVSVFNGQKWQNYEVVGGLSRPDSLSGPIGERIFHIAVCPTDGDVWMASSAGLARYSQSKNSWSYYTRSDGLPSDQASSLAFDKDGNIYVATQCDGLAMADAADGYSRWRVVTGPYELVTTPNGVGLPGNLLNDVLVASDGTVYVATDAGLAWSADRGKNWRFVRGADWAEKVRQSAAGPPKGWSEISSAILLEDYCTCLTEVAPGRIWVGHRNAGIDVVDQSGSPFAAISETAFARAIVSGQSVYAGTYGAGVRSNAIGSMTEVGSGRVWNEHIADLPSDAGTPTPAQLVAISRQLGGVTNNPPAVCFLDEDWRTQGDWVGRYGRQYAILCAAHWPTDDFVSPPGQSYGVQSNISPHHDGKDVLRRWMQWKNTTDVRCLYDPIVGHRVASEWDDHGESYSPAYEGPDIKVHVTIPAGTQRITLYFCNENGHDARNAFRDYLVEVAPPGAANRGLGTEARARVSDFFNGVYESFEVMGPGVAEITIRREYSLNADCSAVLLDRISEGGAVDDGEPPISMGHVHYNPPKAGKSTAGDVLSRGIEDDLWHRIVEGYGWSFSWPAGVLIYRDHVSQSDAASSANLRWNLRIWNSQDRLGFDEVMKRAWKAFSPIAPVRK